MTNEEIREKILADAMSELKTSAGSVIEAVMSNLYSDYLPHVASDTESNIAYRVEGCIRSMISGKYVKSESGSPLVWVEDGYGHEHLINLASYNMALKPLCDLMSETIQSERIKQLENEVDSLKSQLQDAYRR